MTILRIASTMALSLVATSALAHPRLVEVTPAPNGVSRPTTSLSLTFSESLVPKFTGAEVIMTAMPGMASHPPMKVNGISAAEGRVLRVRFARPLAPGTYRVDWHAVSTDTHRVKGQYVFRVG
ncbi:copper homeostasis periplasmic binding protein CopC [Sphingomonas sp.]|uniref:copper homeostasis periplasmic binding protein CopC n=1 Tax=Sphingomonas sp. TaxID=28214 RepID=UPI00258673EE|nr:copper homeostasis periplasmic binding protein CopC [Sphingomonas sp.]